jgi:hypothetical protein
MVLLGPTDMVCLSVWYGSSKHQLRFDGHCSRRCAKNMLGIRVGEAICCGEIEYTCVVVVVVLQQPEKKRNGASFWRHGR